MECTESEQRLFYFNAFSAQRLCVQGHSPRQFRSVLVIGDDQNILMTDTVAEKCLSVHVVRFFASIADGMIMWRDLYGCLLIVYSSSIHLKLDPLVIFLKI